MKIFQPSWGDRSTGTEQEDKLPGASENFCGVEGIGTTTHGFTKVLPGFTMKTGGKNDGFTGFYHENSWKMMVLPWF